MYDRWASIFLKQMVYFCLGYDSVTWCCCQHIKRDEGPPLQLHEHTAGLLLVALGGARVPMLQFSGSSPPPPPPEVPVTCHLHTGVQEDIEDLEHTNGAGTNEQADRSPNVTCIEQTSNKQRNVKPSDYVITTQHAGQCHSKTSLTDHLPETDHTGQSLYYYLVSLGHLQFKNCILRWFSVSIIL